MLCYIKGKERNSGIVRNAKNILRNLKLSIINNSIFPIHFPKISELSLNMILSPKSCKRCVLTFVILAILLSFMYVKYNLY